MLTSRILACLAALFLLVPGAMATDAKIGYINMQKVGNEAPQAVRAMRKLRSEFDKREQDIKQLEASYKALQEKLEKDGEVLSASERRMRERELADTAREMQMKKRDLREDWSLRRNEELMVLNETVAKVIKKIAETEKYDLIVQEAVYASQAIDITGKVIKALHDVNGSTASVPASK